MDMPSTLGLKVRSQSYLPEWEKLGFPEDFNVVEKWAIDNLQPRSAAIGSFNQPFLDRVQLGQFWIIRRGDYDTGRPNIEIQIRVTRDMRTHVWDMRNDVLIYGRLQDFHLTTRFERAHGSDGLQWEQAVQQSYKTTDVRALGPSTKARNLFNQCWALSTDLSAWAASQMNALSEQNPRVEDAALYNLLTASPLWMAANTSLYENLYHRIKINAVDERVKTHVQHHRGDSWRYRFTRDMRDRDRLSTPAQLEFYRQLKGLHDRFLQRTAPPTRASLLRAHTLWFSVCCSGLKKFMC